MDVLSITTLAFNSDFEGIVLEGSEGEHIAQTIGLKKAMILQNHGLLTASDSVEVTVFWYASPQKLCHTHLLALAAVGGDSKRKVEVGGEQAAKFVFVYMFSLQMLILHSSYLSLGQPMSGWLSAKPLFNYITEDTKEAYLAGNN
jgi:hypothetical protein